MTDDDLFDPMNEEFDNDGGDYPDDWDLDEAGEYMLAFVYFHEMRTSTNGNPFARIKARVLHGAGQRSKADKTGAQMWESVFLNRRAHKRLSAYCKAMGFTDRFNHMDEEDLKRALLHRPFIARVRIEVNGKYRDARIKWPLEREWTRAEQEAAGKYLQEHEANAATGRSGGGGNAPGANDYDKPPADAYDDVPF